MVYRYPLEAYPFEELQRVSNPSATIADIIRNNYRVTTPEGEKSFYDFCEKQFLFKQSREEKGHKDLSTRTLFERLPTETKSTIVKSFFEQLAPDNSVLSSALFELMHQQSVLFEQGWNISNLLAISSEQSPPVSLTAASFIITQLKHNPDGSVECTNTTLLKGLMLDDGTIIGKQNTADALNPEIPPILEIKGTYVFEADGSIKIKAMAIIIYDNTANQILLEKLKLYAEAKKKPSITIPPGMYSDMVESLMRTITLFQKHKHEIIKNLETCSRELLIIMTQKEFKTLPPEIHNLLEITYHNISSHHEEFMELSLTDLLDVTQTQFSPKKFEITLSVIADKCSLTDNQLKIISQFVGHIRNTCRKIDAITESLRELDPELPTIIHPEEEAHKACPRLGIRHS